MGKRERGARTKVISIHTLRRAARKKERALTEGVESMVRLGVSVQLEPDGTYRLPAYGAPRDPIPGWAQGFRVEKAGRFSWAVVATERRGR